MNWLTRQYYKTLIIGAFGKSTWECFKHDDNAVAELAKVAIGLGVTAITCGVVSYVLATIGTMISSNNTTTILNYGQTAMMTLAQWLGIIALAVGVFYVIQYFKQIR